MTSTSPILPDSPPIDAIPKTGRDTGSLYDPLGLLHVRGGIDTRVLLVAGEANTDAAETLLAAESIAVIGVLDDRPLTIDDIHLLMDAGAEHFVLWWPRSAESHAGQTIEQVASLTDRAGATALTVWPHSQDAASIKAKAQDPKAVARKAVENAEEIDAQRAVREQPTDWPKLTRPVLPLFPLESLPPEIHLAAEAIAGETQTPPDVAAVSMLGVLSAVALGMKVNVNGSSWEEELCLYFLVALPTGEHKSSVLKLVAAPLREIERQVQEHARDEVRQARTKLETLAERRKQLVKRVGATDDAEQRSNAELELEEVDAEIARIGEPVEPRLLLDNVTPETLGALLASHGRMAIMASEGTFLENTLGRYDAKGSANLGNVCNAYAGESTIVDRRRGSERLERPLLAIFIAAQEHVLRDLVEHQTARSQGLVNRFAYAIPESLQGDRQMRPDRAPQQLLDAWQKIVDRVHSVVSEIGSEHQVMSLSSAARDVLDQYRERQERRLREDGDLRPIADLVTRDPGRAVRIAALLHLCERSPKEPIDSETMEKALNISSYFLAHGAAAVTQPDPTMRRALRWLAARESEVVTRRDLNRGPFQRLKVDEVKVLIDELCNLGALRAVEDEPGARATGRRSTVYVVNPELRGGSSK